ncbi:unnamed protein product [Calypogeia fissa]
MATMIASAAVVAPYGLGRFSPLSVGRKSRVGGRDFAAAVAVKASLKNSQSSSTGPLPSIDSLFQDAPKIDVARDWTSPFGGADFGKFLTPIAAFAGSHLQDAASALEEVESPPEDLLVIVGISAVYAFLYFLVIPAIVYNYLRLRWYKRNAAETVFQFMLVFVFFPGMLLLAPFINFRRLPRKGAEPP